MDLQCLVIPRAGLVPADCKRLGEALHRWRSADPAARSLDQPGLDDLRDGELPPPRYARHVRAAQGRANKASAASRWSHAARHCQPSRESRHGAPLGSRLA